MTDEIIRWQQLRNCDRELHIVWIWIFPFPCHRRTFVLPKVSICNSTGRVGIIRMSWALWTGIFDLFNNIRRVSNQKILMRSNYRKEIWRSYEIHILSRHLQGSFRIPEIMIGANTMIVRWRTVSTSAASLGFCKRSEIRLWYLCTHCIMYLLEASWWLVGYGCRFGGQGWRAKGQCS